MRKRTVLLLLAALLLLAGCGNLLPQSTQGESAPRDESAYNETAALQEESAETAAGDPAAFSFGDIPAYFGEPSVEVNGGEPYFTAEELAAFAPEAKPEPVFTDFDAFGRAGACTALAGPETMPKGERGDIHEIRPSGWQSVRYAGIDGEFLYNRCHLIAWQLIGSDDPRNLITGTRYLNIEGMQPWEDKIAYAIYRTDAHVLCRATPIFADDELVCRGVLLEAVSAEDAGKTLRFCVFCYNVQPGVAIDYATGDSEGPAPEEAATAEESSDSREPTYIGNRNSMRFHRPDCESVQEMSERNKVFFYGGREEPVAAGYTPCGVCRP